MTENFFKDLKNRGLSPAWQTLMAPLAMSREQSMAELRLWCDYFTLGSLETVLYVDSHDDVCAKIASIWPTWQSLLEQRLTQRTPIQYLTGEAWFMGERFLVRPPCLIPRPETELLIEAITKKMNTAYSNKKTPLHLWEIGCGSGALCLSIIKHTTIPMTTCAGDICPHALTLTQDNVTLHSLSDITVIESNLLTRFPKETLPDFIVANLPYIDTLLASTMSPEVLEHEGHHTLFSEQEGYALIHQLIEQSASLPEFTGILALEFGEGMDNRIRQKLTHHGFIHQQWMTDYAGIIRHVLASKNGFIA